MANVQISDLPFATLPLVGATTFFEVEATEGGVVVSRRVAADDLTISVTSLVITGTSTDDPSIGAGTFDGRLLWQNANALQTGVFGFDPAGDNFIWSNDAEGGFHQIAIRDGTVLVETIAAAGGGLLVNNLSTGAGLERVLTTADITVTPALGGLTDVTLTAPATGAVLYKSAGDWLDTPGVLIDPAADVKLHQATVEVFRTLTAAAGGAEANNTLTGGGFERVLTASDAFVGIIEGSSVDSPETPGGTWDGVLRFDNANSLQTARVGFDPAGDTFYVQPTVEGGRLILGGRSPGAPGVLRESIVIDFDTGGLPAGSMRFFEPNGTAEVMRLDTGVPAVTQVANVGGNPAAGNSMVGMFQITNNTALLTAHFGFDLTVPTTTLTLKNFIHGGPVQLVGETGAGVENLIFFGDPDSNSTMLHAGEQRFFTGAAGEVNVNAETADDPIINLTENFVLQSSLTHDVGTDETIWENAQNGGSTIIRGRSDAAEVRNVIDIDYSSAGGFIIFREPNGTQELMRLDTGVNAVTQKANSVNQPSGGFAQVGMFRVQNRNASPEIAMHVGFDETIPTTTLSLKNFTHGGAVQLVGENAAGTERILFFYDPDNSGAIFFGPLDNNPATDASIQDTRLTFRNPSAQTIWQIGFLEGTNNFSIKLAQDTGTLRLRGSSAASADVLMAEFDPVGAAQLMNAGAIRFLTSTLGATVRGSAVDAVTLIMEDSAGTDMLTVTGTSTLVTFVSERDGSTVRFRGSDLGASIRTLWEADPDGDFSAFRVGSLRAGTRFDGWRILGLLNNVPSAGGTQDVSLEFQNGVGTIAGALRYNTSIDMRIENFVHGGSIFMLAEDTGGTLRSLIFMDPDGPNSILLHEVGVAVARTATAALGGLFANNTLTGAGFERVLTIADRTSAAAYTPTNVVTTRTYDANATSIDELADVLGTLIADLQAINVIQ